MNSLLRGALLALLLTTPSLAAGDLWYSDGDVVIRLENSTPVVVGTMPGGVVGIAVNAAGEAWVASRDESRLRRFAADGTLLLDLVTVAPLQGVAVADDDSIWCTRPTLGDVWHVGPDGADLGSVAVGAVPYGLAIDGNGTIWVANSFGNSVTRIAATGTVLEIPVGFFPSTLAVHPDGTVWVAEKEAVRHLSSAGLELGAYTPGVFPLGIAIDRSGQVWVSNQNSHNVIVYAADGTTLYDIPTGEKPRGIGAAGDGTVWVVCRFAGEVRRYSATGALLETVPAGYPDGVGDLTGFARAVTVDPSGDVDADGAENFEEAELGFDLFDPLSSPALFVRGDANRDGTVALDDAIVTLGYLYGGVAVDCPEALDIDDDGHLDLADPIYLIGFLWSGGTPPNAPFPDLGPDPMPDVGYPCVG